MVQSLSSAHMAEQSGTTNVNNTVHGEAVAVPEKCRELYVPACQLRDDCCALPGASGTPLPSQRGPIVGCLAHYKQLLRRRYHSLCGTGVRLPSRAGAQAP